MTARKVRGNRGFPGALDVLATLDDAPLPEGIKADAATALGVEHVIYRDI